VRHSSRSRTKVRPGLPSSLAIACHPRPLCPTISGCRYSSTALSSVCAPPIQIATRQKAIVSLTVSLPPLSPLRPFRLEAEARLLAPWVTFRGVFLPAEGTVPHGATSVTVEVRQRGLGVLLSRRGCLAALVSPLSQRDPLRVSPCLGPVRRNRFLGLSEIPAAIHWDYTSFYGNNLRKSSCLSSPRC